MKKLTLMWLAPKEYATIVNADTKEPLTNQYPDGMLTATVEGQLVKISNMTKEQAEAYMESI